MCCAALGGMVHLRPATLLRLVPHPRHAQQACLALHSCPSSPLQAAQALQCAGCAGMLLSVLQLCGYCFLSPMTSLPCCRSVPEIHYWMSHNFQAKFAAIYGPIFSAWGFQGHEVVISSPELIRCTLSC